MKGYYVIPSEGDPIEICGRNARSRAIKEALTLYKKGDSSVIVHGYDDDDPDGFAANGEYISTKELIKENK